MKKLFFLSITLCLIFLTGCSKYTEKSLVKDLNNKINKISGYHIDGDMTIYSGDNKYEYKVQSSYESSNYRVSLMNKSNNHEQIILKNSEGVYVLTPSLNKSFKFQSDWPKNNSQVYLLQSVLNDINKDKNVKLETKGNEYILSTKISYSSNKNLNNQKIYMNKKLDFKKIEVFDKTGNLQIKMKFNGIDTKASFNNKYFSTSENMKSAKLNESDSDLDSSSADLDSNNKEESIDSKEENELNENNTQTDENNNEDSNVKDETDESTSSLDETIYPMFLPDGTYLSTEETVSKEEGERTILTFAGDTPFILVEEVATASKDFETIPVYGEPTILLDCIGALSNNSANFISNGIEYYISGENLSQEDIINVVESINSISVMK